MLVVDHAALQPCCALPHARRVARPAQRFCLRTTPATRTRPGLIVLGRVQRRHLRRARRALLRRGRVSSTGPPRRSRRVSPGVRRPARSTGQCHRDPRTGRARHRTHGFGASPLRAPADAPGPRQRRGSGRGWIPVQAVVDAWTDDTGVCASRRHWRSRRRTAERQHGGGPWTPAVAAPGAEASRSTSAPRPDPPEPRWARRHGGRLRSERGTPSRTCCTAATTSACRATAGPQHRPSPWPRPPRPRPPPEGTTTLDFRTDDQWSRSAPVVELLPRWSRRLGGRAVETTENQTDNQPERGVMTTPPAPRSSPRPVPRLRAEPDPASAGGRLVRQRLQPGRRREGRQGGAASPCAALPTTSCPRRAGYQRRRHPLRAAPRAGHLAQRAYEVHGCEDPGSPRSTAPTTSPTRRTTAPWLLCLATSTDLFTWTKHGLCSPTSTRSCPRARLDGPWSKAGGSCRCRSTAATSCTSARARSGTPGPRT